MIIILNEALTFRNFPRTVFSEGRRDREIDMTPISRTKVTEKLTRAQLFFEVKSEEKCIPCLRQNEILFMLQLICTVLQSQQQSTLQKSKYCCHMVAVGSV